MFGLRRHARSIGVTVRVVRPAGAEVVSEFDGDVREVWWENTHNSRPCRVDGVEVLRVRYDTRKLETFEVTGQGE
jgi:hypothetical protein